MLKTTTALFVLVAWIMLGFIDPRLASAGDPGALGADFAAPTAAIPDSIDANTDSDTRSFTLHYQIGVLVGLTGGYRGETSLDEPEFSLNLDLTGLFGDPRRITWGVGGHVVFADDDIRAGLKIPWRFPIDRAGKNYFQVSPGIYLWGEGDSAVFGLPGYFCELEVGHANVIAAAFSLEVLPYDSRYIYDGYGSVRPLSGSITNINAGIKIGQVPGIITTVALIAAGAAVAASYAAQSGSYFGG